MQGRYDGLQSPTFLCTLSEQAARWDWPLLFTDLIPASRETTARKSH